MFWRTPSTITKHLRHFLFYLILSHPHILQSDLISTALPDGSPSYQQWLQCCSAVISHPAGSSLSDVSWDSWTICLSYLPIIPPPQCHSAPSCGTCSLYLMLIRVEFRFLISEVAPQSAVRFLYLNLLKLDHYFLQKCSCSLSVPTCHSLHLDNETDALREPLSADSVRILSGHHDMYLCCYGKKHSFSLKTHFKCRK